MARGYVAGNVEGSLNLLLCFSVREPCFDVNNSPVQSLTPTSGYFRCEGPDSPHTLFQDQSISNELCQSSSVAHQRQPSPQTHNYLLTPMELVHYRVPKQQLQLLQQALKSFLGRRLVAGGQDTRVYDNAGHAAPP